MKNLTELSTRNSPRHLLKVKRNIWHNLVKPDPIKQLSDGELNDIFMLHYFLSSFSIFFPIIYTKQDAKQFKYEWTLHFCGFMTLSTDSCVNSVYFIGFKL